MKRRFMRLISLVLTLLTVLSTSIVFASATWLSPLAEMGDVNNSGVIEAIDARMILRASARLVTLVPPIKKWPKDKVYGDVTGDGKITAKDARIVLRRAAGLPDEEKDTDKPVTDPVEIFKNDAEIFLSGKFHLIGKMGSDDNFVDINLASDGKNLYTLMDFEENLSLGILLLNNRFYFINHSNKTYAEISKVLFSQMGINIEDLSIEMPSASNAKLVKTEKVTEDGKELNVLTYQETVGAFLKFYLDDTKLVRLETYSDYALVSTILIDSITSDVSKILSVPSGYAKKNILSFLQPLI